MDGFDVPVCNSFQAKVLNDQLCYEVDPNQYTSKESSSAEEIKQRFKQGLTLYIDTNDDRQTTSKNTEFMIYINTLGGIFSLLYHISVVYFFYFLLFVIYHYPRV